ncbi:MAG: hypothetical protein U1D06_12335 [Paracoccaceae bacterium]|nr:hypothetical protein [Paracoccaceae bacterium]
MRGLAFAPPLLLAFLSAGPLLAQAVLYDVAAVSTGCAQNGESCLAAVRGQIATLRARNLTPVQFNTQIASLAGVVADIARTAPAAARAGLAQTLRALAQSSGNPQQAAAILRVAGLVEAGTMPAPVAVAQELSAS